MTGRIQRLEDPVINRIAAGEVIQRPANAIKEMIENSLDAGSTLIQVTVKSGGLKMLQVQDNGKGIEKDDLNIVCERFTTSKLEKFEDLSHLHTYGFRGEALASISHVAHVTVTSKTQSSQCAYKAEYTDGVMRLGPKLCAGNTGTIITVEDLFYNVATRRKAIKSPFEEFARIIDIMTRYAIHNSGIGFTLKKHGTAIAEIKTSPDNSIQENIGLLYGASVQKELVFVETDNKEKGFRMTGYITNANYSVKKWNFLLFINHRLVDSQSLRKALEIVYGTILPKNSHPFIYMSIFINPENIDVNVHPTKHEVHFLHEEIIIDSIQKTIEESLLNCNSSRTYYMQSLLPSTSAHISGASAAEEESKVYDFKLVRTDAKEKKISAFVLPKSLTNEQADLINCARKPVHLTSVLSLQSEIKKNRHDDLYNLFCNHSFVGCIDQTKVLLQYETGIFLVDLSRVSKELFFQLIISDFSNFGALKLSPPAPIYEMVSLAIESPTSGWTVDDGPKEKIAQYVVEFLDTKAEMLLEYFCLEIKDGLIYTLPALLDNYTPNLDRLPYFLLCLAVEVDWTSEKKCFLSFAQECASFYSIQQDSFLSECTSPVSNLYKDTNWQWVTQHVLLPALRSKLSPPCTLAQDGTVLKIADLHELYKVFERC